MQGKSYVKNAAILTLTGIALRIAGMFFRVYIAARVGAAGMGLYQLIFTVYNLAATLATAGLSIVATRVAAGLFAKGAIGEVRTDMRKILALGAGLGVFAAVLLYFLAPQVSRSLLADERAYLALQILAPSLPFMALSAVMRGYFMARREVAPNARAQVFEQIVRIAIVAVVLDMFIDKGVGIACAAVVFGNTVSEALSWCYMQYCYVRDTKLLPQAKKCQPIMRSTLALLAPIAANQYITSILHTIENVLVPACLAMFLLSREDALAQFGALKGMAMPVLFFPFSFIGTLATLLLPEITEAYVRKEEARLHRLINRVLIITLTTSILASTLYTVFASEIGLLLYKSNEIGFYLMVLGPLAPFMYLESMVDGILKGLDQQVATFRYTVVDSIMRIILTVILLPRYGMKGFLFVMLCSNLLTSLLNLQRLLRVTSLPFQWKSWLLKPLFSAGAAAVALRFVLRPIFGSACSMLIFTITGVLFVSFVYMLFLFLTGSVKMSDFSLKK